MTPRKKNEIVEESYYTLIFCSLFICEIKKYQIPIIKKLLNSYICHIGCPNYQITSIVYERISITKQNKIPEHNFPFFLLP